nr:hypothetical protein [Ktedonobacteraceae bacterium]
MTTICSKCGSVLAANADILFCPQCGTPTPSYYANTAASLHEPTASAAPLQPPPQTSATDYGSNPYGAPLQNPYEPSNPYEAPLPLSPLPPPPPPPSPSRRPKFGLLIGIVALVLIIVGVSVGVLLSQQAKNTSTGNTSLSTTTPTQSSVANAEKNPYSPNTGTMVLNDPLTDNSKGYGWDEATASDGSFCKFIGGAYHANQADPRYIHPCFALNTNFSNFTYELKMTILKGNCGGLIFMADGANSKYFVFDVCQNGTFSLFYFSGFGQSGTWVLTPQNTSIINTGLNQSNLIAVVANNNNFDLYVNSQKIDSVVDDAYNHGEIGVIADPLSNSPTEVVYSNAKVWSLP